MRSSVAAPTRSAGSAWGIVVVTAQLAVQRRGVDAQHFRGAGLVAALAVQHPRDVGALDHVERRVGVRPLGDQGLGPVLGELVRKAGRSMVAPLLSTTA